MQWGPDVDAKLFMHVLKIHNIRLDYQALAMAMGNDITPKAISHRIAKLRSIADGHTTAAASSSPGLGLLPIIKRSPNKRARGSSIASDNSIPSASPTSAGSSSKNVSPTKTAGAKLGSASAAGRKRNTSGRAKIGGSPLKNENLVDDGDDVVSGAEGAKEEEAEVKTPSKKVKASGLGAAGGFGNGGLNPNFTVHEDEDEDASTEESA